MLASQHDMKHILLTTIAAVVLVGCGPSVDIWEAAKEGNIESVKQYLDAGGDVDAKNDDWDGMTPLHYAVQLDHKEVAELLIAKGADVNVKEYLLGYTPLHLATIYGEKEAIELLIAKGADVNAMNKRGKTPLHVAAEWGDKEKAELLIAAGTDVNAKHPDGKTPLDLNYFSDEIADLLRKHGGKTSKELKAEAK